jgi:hypothetical protein
VVAAVELHPHVLRRPARHVQTVAGGAGHSRPQLALEGSEVPLLIADPGTGPLINGLVVGCTTRDIQAAAAAHVAQQEDRWRAVDELPTLESTVVVAGRLYDRRPLVQGPVDRLQALVAADVLDRVGLRGLRGGCWHPSQAQPVQRGDDGEPDYPPLASADGTHDLCPLP